ncbi:MAG: DUF2946 domain-containing protein [Comamonadaceae bacterium]|nr:MAG: DUF2946 domain-containing protein [Comamonadaceae bacterium]
MQWLRHSTCIARMALAWLVLAVGVAAASPLVHPQSMELVCGAAGVVKLVVTHDDGSVQEMGQHTLDCALCLPAGGPPLALSLSAAAVPHALAHALRPAEVARLAALVGAPLPARGPPRSVLI